MVYIFRRGSERAVRILDSHEETMQKPEHISDKRWKQHLDWMQVTGEARARNLKVLQEQRTRPQESRADKR